jgi:hypothetical protein
MRVAASSVILGLVLAVRVAATTYLPVTFDDLVRRADVIFVGDVTDVRPFVMQSRGDTIVMTRVSFSVVDPLFGTSSLVEVFDFLGGQVGDAGMRVAGMPQFAVGDRHVVFARREQSINPIVGFTQGLLRVSRDPAGVDRVQTLDRHSLDRVENIGRAISASAAVAAPMRLADLRDRIITGLRQAGRQ